MVLMVVKPLAFEHSSEDMLYMGPIWDDQAEVLVYMVGCGVYESIILPFF